MIEVMHGKANLNLNQPITQSKKIVLDQGNANLNRPLTSPSHPPSNHPTIQELVVATFIAFASRLTEN